MKITPLAAGLVAGALALSGCQGGSQASADDYPSRPVTMTAGADPGSGFDTTIRSVVEALQKEDIVDVPMPVENRPGAIGAVFLASMVERYKGDDDQVSVTSLSMMTNELRGMSEYGYDDVTMIARLMTEYFVVVAGADSDYQDLADVLDAVKKNPGEVAVGAATDDQIPFNLLVAAAGGDPTTVNYVTYEGGGDQSTALLNGDIDVAIAGVSEFVSLLESGDLRGLGVLSEERLPGLDTPTAAEQGLDVTLANWRGIYGPPDMPEYAVDYWRDALAEMVETPTWEGIAERNQFTTTFMVGDEFDTYLEETQADVKTALEETGQL